MGIRPFVECEDSESEISKRISQHKQTKHPPLSHRLQHPYNLHTNPRGETVMGSVSYSTVVSGQRPQAQ